MKASGIKHQAPGAAQDGPVLRVVSAALELELVLSADKTRAVAVLIPARMNIAHLEACYALGRGVWRDCRKLARWWSCWGVLADPAWAEQQLAGMAHRPKGARFFFIGD